MADGTSFGFSHSRILLCDAAGVVVFQPRGLWPTFCSLKKIVMTQSIAHVVQAMEKRHGIVSVGRKILGRGLLKFLRVWHSADM
jgi:hypothetical protein